MDPGTAPTPLVERDAELRALAAAVEAARTGRGQAVLVRAPAGMGKSRLLAKAAGLAPSAALQAGHEPDRERPFALVRRLVAPLLDAAGERERAWLLSGAAGLAAPLFAGDEPPADDGFALVHGMFWLVANLAERAPLVLAADDLQWADDASLRVLNQLARHVGTLPLALVLAARDAPARPRIDALEDRVGVVLRPGPLSAAAVAERVRAAGFAGADDAFCAACAEVTGGNPFRLGELLRTLRDAAVAPTAAAVDRVHAAGPGAVGRAALDRLAALGPDAVAYARALAVLGAADAAVVAAAAGADAEAALVAAGVLAPGPAFAHPLIRAAVLDALGEDERRAVHTAAARALAAAGAGADQLAAQLLHVAPGALPDAHRPLVAAARTARAAGAPARAADLLARALAEDLGEPLRTAVETDLARAEIAAGEAGGIDRLEAVAARLDGAERARVLGEIGRAHQDAGRLPEALGAFGAAVALVGDAGDAVARDVRADYVALALWVPGGQEEALGLVRGLVEQGRDAETLAERVLLSTLAAAEAFALGSPERAAALARRAWGEGAWLAQGGRAQLVMSNITGVLNAIDAFAEVARVSDAALEDAARRGDAVSFGGASYLRGSSAALAGHAAVAQDHLERSLALDLEGWDSWRPSARGFLAEALLLRGERDRAEELLALPSSGRSPEGQTMLDAWFWQARGMLDRVAGDHAGALQAFTLVGRLMAEGIGSENPAVLAWRSGAALAAAGLGDEAAAREHAEAEVALARAWGAARTLATALTAYGRVTGDLAALEEAAACIAGVDAPRAEAEALLALGRTLLGRDDRAAARDPLRRALDVARRAGAEALAASARAELVRAGGRPRRAAQTGVEALTAAERRVATLAAAGRTNREIAEALFVTLKTVEWHLSLAYRKLGAPGRAQLAAALDAG